MDIHPELIDTIKRVQTQLTAAGLPTEWYTIENYSGYSSVTGNPTDTVYCIEANVGPYPDNPAYTTYAIAQIFWDKYLNMSITALVTMDSNGQPVGKAIYTPEIDKNFSTIFLPMMYRAFNNLDPKGGSKGQVVQRYTNTKIQLKDFIPATFFTLRLLICSDLTGQLATIAGDFNDILTRLIALMISPFIKGRNIYVVAATWKKSSIIVPTRNRSNPQGPPYGLQSSTALDKCFNIAKKYLDDYYSS